MIQFPNKVILRGEISNMKLHGHGKLSFYHHSTFQGTFFNNVHKRVLAVTKRVETTPRPILSMEFLLAPNIFTPKK